MTDWGALYRENVAAVSALAATLTEDQLATTVPATPDWNVHEVIAHLAGTASDGVTGRMDGAPGDEWTSRHVGERAGLPVADLVAELRSRQDDVAESAADNPAPALIWNIAVHHADLHEALGLPRLPERLWLPIAEALGPRAGTLADAVPAYELVPRRVLPTLACSRCRRGVPTCHRTSSTRSASSGLVRTTSRYLPRRAVASYALNKAAVARCRELIDAKQYVLDSDWGDVQPSAAAGTSFLDRHSWEDYAAWHLGLTEGANDETKARYAFVYGDYRRVHRTGLIACVYRASEWRHKAVEIAAHDLLQELDKAAGIA